MDVSSAVGLTTTTHRIHATEPVGHHETFIAPVVAQDGGQQVMALTRQRPVDKVIRGHHRPGLCLGDGNLEVLQIELASGTLAHTGVVAHTLRLLVVESEVLDGGAYTLTLDTTDISGGDIAGEDGVLTVVLEVAAAERVAHQAHTRREHDLDTIGRSLLTDGLTNLANERGVPRAG